MIFSQVCSKWDGMVFVYMCKHLFDITIQIFEEQLKLSIDAILCILNCTCGKKKSMDVKLLSSNYLKISECDIFRKIPAIKIDK